MTMTSFESKMQSDLHAQTEDLVVVPLNQARSAEIVARGRRAWRRRAASRLGLVGVPAIAAAVLAISVLTPSSQQASKTPEVASTTNPSTVIDAQAIARCEDAPVSEGEFTQLSRVGGTSSDPVDAVNQLLAGAIAAPRGNSLFPDAREGDRGVLVDDTDRRARVAILRSGSSKPTVLITLQRSVVDDLWMVQIVRVCER